MPLILAIEPNKSQAQQIASLVKHHLRGAELVSAADAEGALKALGRRVPDLVLTPALLAPRDEAALTEHLRQLGAAGSHIHTLAVPIIATAKNRVREVGSGLLGRRKEKADGDSSVGCDPSMFAEQIKVYLDRAAREREASVEVLEVAETHQAQSDETDESGDGDFSEMVWLPDEPAVVIEAPPPPVPVDPPLVTHHVRAEPPVPVIEPERPPTVPVEQPPPRMTTAATRAFEAEFGLPTAGSGTPLWRVAEVGIEALTEPEPLVEPEPTISAAPPMVGADQPQIEPPAETPVPVVTQSTPDPRPAPKGAAKPARARKPAADDWTYFDPYQSPFKALVRRLDEIAGHV